MGNLITAKEYEVHYYEVDYKKRALITSIMNYFDDVAIKQSEEGNVGLDYMAENKIAWVLYKWDINIYKYPLHGEKIKVRTNPRCFRRFYAYRTFDIMNENGEILVEASSVWFLIDVEKRKPKKIGEDMRQAFGISEDDVDILEIPKISPIINKNVEKTFNVRYSDIDTNGHVNNVKYVSWAIETVPLEVVKNYLLRNINITYEKETTYGETIKVSTEVIEEENRIICKHIIIDKEGKRLTTAQTIWE